MGPKKNRKNSASSDASSASDKRVTRSQTSDMTAEMTYYTTLNGGGKSSNNIQVVSRKKLAQDPKHYEELEKRFARIKARADVQAKEIEASLAKGSTARSMGGSKKSVIYFVTHFNVFLYATCFFIQVGTMPYLSKSLGADPTVFGQLQTVFAVAQLLGGPLFGRFGDVLGDRLSLVVAFSSSFLSYFLMGIADNLTLLFLSRLPSVFMHVMQGSQMIITYSSSESDRTQDLSRLGFSYGIGMVVGPTLGGFISKHFSDQSASLVAAAGSVLSVILILLFIPNIPKQPTTDSSKSASEKKSESVFNLKKVFGLIFAPGVTILLLIKLVCGIPIGIIQSMFSVIAMEQFGMPAEQNGIMLSYIGIVSLLMQGFGVGALSSRMSDKTMMKLSTVTLTLAYLALSQIHEVWDFILLLFPMTCSLCLVNSILTSALTKTVEISDTGTLLGLNMAVHSVVRSFAPTLGGYLTTAFGFFSLGYVGVAANVICLALIPLARFKTEL